MTLLTAVQVADYWVGAGGPKSRAVEWVAIAMGESGLVTDALSSAGAIGLWQIMPFNAPTYGFTAQDMYDPHNNAVVAVGMSGGGTNCAAWDSCYLDITRSGRYSYLGWPEAGSADYNNLAAASAEMNGAPINATGGASQPGTDDTLAATITRLQDVAERGVPAATLALQRLGQALGPMYGR